MSNQHSSLAPTERLIWSADVDSPQDVLNRLKTEPRIKAVKLDRLFSDRWGRDVVKALIEDLRGFGAFVFLDLKLVEVPSKLEQLAKIHTDAMPAMLNCMAGSVSSEEWGQDLTAADIDGLTRFAHVCHEKHVMPVGVSVLTSKTEKTVANEFHGRTAVEQVLWYVETLLEAGFGGVVCSPQEVAAIRKRPEFDMLELLTPGVRLPGGKAHDQARVTTPGEAIAHGATRVVSGREITNDIEGQNLDRILDEIKAAESMAA